MGGWAKLMRRADDTDDDSIDDPMQPSERQSSTLDLINSITAKTTVVQLKANVSELTRGLESLVVESLCERCREVDRFLEQLASLPEHQNYYESFCESEAINEYIA